MGESLNGYVTWSCDRWGEISLEVAVGGSMNENSAFRVLAMTMQGFTQVSSEITGTAVTKLDNTGDAEHTGSLEQGKKADFILLGRDLIAMARGGNTSEIRQVKVLQTWFDGEIVYEAR